MPGLQDVSIAVGVVGAIAGSVLLVLPGWVLSTVFSRNVRAATPSDRALLMEITFAGMFVHLLALPWTLWLVPAIVQRPQAHLGGVALWVMGVFVVIPATLGLVLGSVSASAVSLPWPWLRTLLSRLGMSDSTRTDSAWAWAFARQTKPGFVRVHLVDGTLIGGRFGDRSLVPADAARRDLYIETLWHLDERSGWFVRPYGGSAGLWISGDRLAMIEFYEGVE